METQSPYCVVQRCRTDQVCGIMASPYMYAVWYSSTGCIRGIMVSPYIVWYSTVISIPIRGIMASTYSVV